MAWRHKTYEATVPNNPTCQNPAVGNISTSKEPPWVSVLPAARGIWNMIVTFRERGSHEIADDLEASAEKQAEAHLKTQQLMMNKHKPPQIQTPPNQSPTYKQTKSRTHSLPLSGSEDISSKRSSQRTSMRNSQCSPPNQYSMATTSESEWESEGEVEDGDHERSRSQKPSVRLEPPSPLSSTAASPTSLSPTSPTPAQARDQYFKTPALKMKNPHACYHSRLKTYERSKYRWGSPSPSELSEAGFFFIGPRDSVQCFSCDTCQNCWKPAEDPWVRHTRRSPSCDYLIETRGADFISAILNSVEKVKNGLMNSYSCSNSNSSMKGSEPEFSKMKNGLLNPQAKLKETKTGSSSGWRLDPYKERGVVSGPAKSTAKRKKKQK